MFARFEIAGELGQGGMGVVYRARDPLLGREVALKVLRSVLAGADPIVAERFKREARAAAALQHPGIVRVLEFGEEAGQLFLVAELVEGGRTLSGEIGPAPVEEVRPAVERFLSLVEAVATRTRTG